MGGQGPRRRFQTRSGRRLEAVTKAVGAVTVGYKCRWGWQLWSGRGRLGISWGPGKGGTPHPPFQRIPVEGLVPLSDALI